MLINLFIGNDVIGVVFADGEKVGFLRFILAPIDVELIFAWLKLMSRIIRAR